MEAEKKSPVQEEENVGGKGDNDEEMNALSSKKLNNSGDADVCQTSKTNYVPGFDGFASGHYRIEMWLRGAEFGYLNSCKALVQDSRDESERKMLLNSTGMNDWTALHYAAWGDQDNVVKWILSDDEGGGRRQGFDSLMARDKEQATALHVAAERGHLSCCKALVESCRDVNERRELLNAVTKYDRTVLHCAIRDDGQEIIEWLVSNEEGGGRQLGFDLFMARDDDQRTALLRAAQFGRLSCCQAILDGCRDSNERLALIQDVDERGQTILHHASYHRSVDILRWMVESLDMESIYNIKDNNGYTALHHLARRGRIYGEIPPEDFVDVLLFAERANEDNNEKRAVTLVDPNIGCGVPNPNYY